MNKLLHILLGGIPALIGLYMAAMNFGNNPPTLSGVAFLLVGIYILMELK